MERNKYIGGADIAALCGVSRYKGEYEVWLSKTSEAFQKPSSSAMEWGNRLEKVVADKFAENHAFDLIPGRPIAHPEHAFVGGTPDFIYVEADGSQGVLEVKTTNQYNAKDWDNGDCPDEYLLQLQWYLMLTGLTYGYLAVLIGGQDYREVRIIADVKLHKNMLAIAQNFWHNYVETRTPPPCEMRAETIALVYGKDDGSTKQLTHPASFIETLKAKEAEIKRIEAEVEAMKNEIKQALGESTFGLIDNRFLVEWKTVNRKGYEVKPTSCRQFRIKEIGTKLVEA